MSVLLTPPNTVSTQLHNKTSGAKFTPLSYTMSTDIHSLSKNLEKSETLESERTLSQLTSDSLLQVNFQLFYNMEIILFIP